MAWQKAFLGGLALLVAVAAGPASVAAEDNVKDLKIFTCKDVMRLEDDDRRVVIGFLHGYRAGQAGNLTVDITRLSKITDMFIDQCLDKPKSKAIDVFMALYK